MTNKKVSGGDAAPVTAGARLVLAAVAVGLAAMLAAALLYRFGGTPLVKRAPNQPVPPIMEGGESRSVPLGMGMGMDGDDPTQAGMIAAMQILKDDPNNVDALLKLADIFMAQENPGSAQGFVNRALVAAPADPRPLYYLGVLKAGQGDYEGAVEAMERSLSIADSPATRYSLAIIYIYHLKARDRGMSHLKIAVQSDDLDPTLKTLIDEELARE